MDFPSYLSDSDFAYVSSDDPPTPPHSPLSAPLYREAVEAYIRFTNANPTTYHVVAYFSRLFEAHGFTPLDEKTTWTLPPGRYFTTRSGTSLVAFTVGAEWEPLNGCGAIGAHIDSLTVKLKPRSHRLPVEGYNLLGVAPYSGSLNALWVDRDLGIAGRVIVKVGDRIELRLVSSAPSPIARIPSLAPHFGVAGELNRETQMVPIVAFGPASEATELEKKAPLYGSHSLDLLRYIAREACTQVENILLMDLDLFDVQLATLGGLALEFVFGPRTDDRLCSFAAVWGLLRAVDHPSVQCARDFNLVALFDNEEIGSGTRQGAQGGLLQTVVDRVTVGHFLGQGRPVSTSAAVVYANSIFLSADVTHCLNPNFKNAYLDHHYPLPNTGITIKSDPNGHVATDSVGLAFVEALGHLNGDKLQRFHIRNDGRSGSTIGPFLSSATSARTIDVGICQLSMHSIRAMFGLDDVGLGIKFFAGFYHNWRRVYDSFGDL